MQSLRRQEYTTGKIALGAGSIRRKEKMWGFEAFAQGLCRSRNTAFSDQ
jgi:hypothetical protein